MGGRRQSPVLDRGAFGCLRFMDGTQVDNALMSALHAVGFWHSCSKIFPHLCASHRYPAPAMLLLAVIVAHVVAAPFTKVEESFMLQATHDLLFHGAHVSAYDHHAFPGVVPRTFLGSAALAALSWAPVQVARAAGCGKAAALVVVRCVLGLAWAASLLRLRRGAETRLGKQAGTWLVVLTLSQFHLPFYASRPLPNVLASVPAHWALAWWLEDGAGGRTGRAAVPASLGLRAVALLAASAAVVRCDLLLLLAPLGLSAIWSFPRLVEGLRRGVAAGLAGVAAALCLSLPLDSALWQRPLWPELEVLLFNTVHNRSAEWGTQPAHWYWTSALPRALHCALALAALGASRRGEAGRACRACLGLGAAFVGLYSLLPHKELRFLFPALCLFNVAAAGGAAGLLAWAGRRERGVDSQDAASGRLSDRAGRERSTFFDGKSRKTACSGATCRQIFVRSALAGMLLLSLAYVALCLRVSGLNYPGGVALQTLHDLHDRGAFARPASHEPLRVHIDVLAAMTGVSRFLERGDGAGERGILYSKVRSRRLPARAFSLGLLTIPHAPGPGRELDGRAAGRKLRCPPQRPPRRDGLCRGRRGARLRQARPPLPIACRNAPSSAGTEGVASGCAHKAHDLDSQERPGLRYSRVAQRTTVTLCFASVQNCSVPTRHVQPCNRAASLLRRPLYTLPSVEHSHDSFANVIMRLNTGTPPKQRKGGT